MRNDEWERVLNSSFRIHHSALLSFSLGLALLLGRLLVARERVRDQLLYLALDLVELHLGGLLELLDGLGARLLDLLREPVLLGEVEAGDAQDDDRDDDAQEDVREVVDV